MSITSSSDPFMNSYRHSTNSVYGTLNPHIQIPISSSTTIPSSAYHFQNPPNSSSSSSNTTNNINNNNSNTNNCNSNNNSNNNNNSSKSKMSFCQTIQPPTASTTTTSVVSTAAQLEDKMDEDLPSTIPKSNISINLNSFTIESNNSNNNSSSNSSSSNQHSSLKSSSSHVPTPNSSNNLKFSQSILPPTNFVNDNNNSNNNNNNLNNINTSPSSSSLSLSSFNEAIMSAASNSNNSSSFSSLSSSPNQTSANSNPLLKLSTLPDSSPPIGMTSPFSYSSSAVFQNPSTSSSCFNNTGSGGNCGSSIGFSSSPTSSFPASSLIDDDRERMRYEFESIKKPEQHHRKAVKSHHRHYSHNDLDSRKHDEEKFFSSLQPNNYSKNRYHDVLPNESTRVRLTPIESGDGDYINANYINGEVPNSYRYYIACQAPLQSTIKDFWRMVWEEKSAVIVCLTRLEEDGKKKADIYWPESSSEPQECGPFWVHLHKKVMFKDIGVSSLHLYRKGEEFPREVVLFHYTQWPDSGAPNTSTHIRTLSVLTNTFKQRGNMKNCNGPVIVHCSAGIGRSGTFIAININMAKIERSTANNEPNVNIQIKDTVVELRRQRRGMVQTFEQYVYIYKVINDVLNDMGRSLASPTKRRSCEMVRQPAMPRLDINSHQPPPTFNPKDIQSITSSAETAASLSIITQMTQTLKFPQSTQFDSNSNPFSKSKIKIPSPLNVSSSNILTVPPTSLSSQLNENNNNNNINNNNTHFNHHHQRSSSTTHIPSSSNFSSLSSHHLFQNNNNTNNSSHSSNLESLNHFGSFGNHSFLIYQNNNNNAQPSNTNENNQKSNNNNNSGGNCNMSFQYNFQNNNDDNGGGNYKQMPQLNNNSGSNSSSSSTSASDNSSNSNSNNNNSNNNRNGGNQDHEVTDSQQQQNNNNNNNGSNPPESPRATSPIKCF